MRDSIEINKLQHIFDNTSECYKLFWFRAIVDSAFNGEKIVSFDTLINQMIVKAWYMVNEYKLKLGPNDTLEKIVNLASQISGLKSNEKEEKIKKFLFNCDNRQLNDYKLTLTYNVPYRLLSPFIGFKDKDYNGRKEDLIQRINHFDNIPYSFDSFNSINTKIIINDAWMEYIKANYQILIGWIDNELVQYIQRKNPNVPGIPTKLYPPEKRDLKAVSDYYKIIIDYKEIRDIYSNQIIQKNNLSIDHFVPWSYVAHDELWNLTPCSKSVNSAKSNELPKWDNYFNRLAKSEYECFKASQENNLIKKEFEECKKKNCNDEKALQYLYKENIQEDDFKRVLNDLLDPTYKAAKNQGFEIWSYHNE